ncbi:V-type ATP synthase subunit E [Ruminococcaceae bacterium OttesenSCG-928-L11]|nr:V-type ATP synthase subunit E [Ruminococcaceae bacterium OttesenSCG-928-L11]
MSGLDNLTAKILEDANKRASEITGAADDQAKSILDEATDEANRDKDRILTDAKTEAARAAEQVTLGKTLAVRDQNLDAKQQTLDKVFASALDSLNNMTEANFKKFLFAYLIALDPDGDELLLPEKFGVSVDDANAALKAAGKKGNLVKSSDSRTIQGGFILSKNGIEQNNTFESLVAFYRYELESEVLKLLY